MAVITPNTDIYLLKVPLEFNDINQLDFANKTAQFNYFNSLPKYEVEEYTYQRKDSTIRFGGNFDELITYNYCMYRNTEYSDKWFYAFITNMEYVNDNMTMITIKTDTWQTWMFDLTYKPCLIDREHVNNDTVGLHTLPEGLELGEFVTNGLTNFGTSGGSCVVVEVSQVENYGDGQTMSYTNESSYNFDLSPDLNDIPRGTIPLIIDYGQSSPSFDRIRSIYDKAGLGDSIINVYPLPRDYVSILGQLNLGKISINVLKNGNIIDTVEHVGIPLTTTGTYTFNTVTFTRPTTLAGYTPVNGKMFTFPYCYFNISNNAGTSLPYHYEDFTGSVSFQLEGTFGVSGNIKALPLNYKNIGNGNSLDYSITGAKIPVGSWKSDSYTNWLTQNAINMGTQWRTTLASAGADIIGGLITGQTGLGLIAGGKELLATAREQHLAKTQANYTPDQVRGNLSAGDINWAKYKSTFTYLSMCIKPEYSRAIDQYFSQFGYKCNLVKLPNVTGRRNWNYVKTVGCYIEADIPQEDLAEIKSMFDRGITIWHHPNTFADYNQPNDII